MYLLFLTTETFQVIVVILMELMDIFVLHGH